MKRNLLPLLGIAFVVALAASGIFYGVFVGKLKQAAQGPPRQSIVVAARSLDRGAVLTAADLKTTSWAGPVPPGSFHSGENLLGKTVYSSLLENEPLTEVRLSGDKSLGIGKGMRAVSVHVQDSAGLLPFLRAGYRVDVQAVQNRGSASATIGTILQNAEVLGVQIPEGHPNAQSSAVVSLLAAPQDADRIALADSAATIRLLLRNQMDTDSGARENVALASLFQARPAPAVAVSKHPVERRVELLVRVGGPTSHSMEDVRSSLPFLQSGPMLQVAALPHGEEGEGFWTTLQRNQHIAPLQVSRLTASSLQPAYFLVGHEMRIRFDPRVRTAGSLGLRVQPEFTPRAPANGIRSQTLVTDLDLQDGQSVVIAGRELIVLATARMLPLPR